MRQPVTLRAVISLLGIATLVLTSTLAFADITPPPPPFSGKCDFLTGGGFIYPNGADKGNFGLEADAKKVRGRTGSRTGAISNTTTTAST